MKKIIAIILVLALPGSALELVRQKNVATYITFPLIDSTTTTALQSGATSPDSEIDTWADGAAPDGFADCTNEVSEIGTTGIYSLSLTQAEMNVDYLVIQCKASDALTQVILIRTTVGDPLNLATTDDGTTINVASGVVEANVEQLADTVQSLTDLKDFADAGYNPATDKVTGVLLTDTCTTNTDLVTAAAVVNEWETQSQADPTGFHVNVYEWIGTAVTLSDGNPDVNVEAWDNIDFGATMKASITTACDTACDTVTVTSMAADVIGVGDIATGAIDHDAMDVDGSELTAIDLPNQTMDITGNISGSVGSLTGHTVQTGDSYALASGATGFAAIDTVVDTILVDTAELQSAIDTNTHYVSKAGDDGNGGNSLGDALLTIGQAVTNASSGDTILIYPGTYASDAVDLDTANKSLTLIGTNREACIINHATGTAVLCEDGTVLKNLTLIGGSGASARGVDVNSKDNVWIENCICSGPSTSGSVDGIMATSSTNLTVRDCIILSEYDGIVVSNATDFLLERCQISTSHGAAAAATYGIKGSGTTRGIIKDCTISAVHATDGQDVYGVQLPDATIMDNCSIISTITTSTADDAVGVTTSGGGTLRNCYIYVYVGSGSGDAKGVVISNNSLVQNCNIYARCNSGTSGDLFAISSASGSYFSLVTGTVLRTLQGGSGADYAIQTVGDLHVGDSIFDDTKVNEVAGSILYTSTNTVTIEETDATDAINTEADTAVSDYDPPTKTEMDSAFTEIKGATWASGTDTLEAIRDRGDAAWDTAVGFSTHDAAAVVTAMQASTGWTAGGTMTLAEVVECISAAVFGDYIDDGGGDFYYKDADDGSTNVLGVSRSTTSPYRDVTVQ